MARNSGLQAEGSFIHFGIAGFCSDRSQAGISRMFIQRDIMPIQSPSGGGLIRSSAFFPLSGPVCQAGSDMIKIDAVFPGGRGISVAPERI